MKAIDATKLAALAGVMTSTDKATSPAYVGAAINYPLADIPEGSDTAPGLVQLAEDTDTTSTDKAVTPKQMADRTANVAGLDVQLLQMKVANLYKFHASDNIGQVDATAMTAANQTAGKFTLDGAVTLDTTNGAAVL